MGGKTATSTQQVQVPPSVLAQYQSVNAAADQTAQTPFQQYGGEFVAPVNSEQQSGITATNTAANEAQPYYASATGVLGGAQGNVTPVNQLATGLAAGSAEQVNPTALSSGAINQYLSPYLSDVVGSEAAVLNQNNQQQQAGQLGNAITSGAFGSDRTGIAAANLEQQQNLANASIYSNLLNTGYNTALSTAQQQQGVGLAAGQANRAALGSAAQTLSGVGQTTYGEGANTASELGALGTGAQTAGLTGAQAQIAAGTVQQQTQQAQDAAIYNQFLQQQSYPFQVDQFLANIAEGTGALSGSTTTTQQPGGFFSDEQLKEDMEAIGKTFDGQTIYRYRMKGDPRERIGLSAQKVERKHPEAVGIAGGYRFVDYGRATQEAANRGHFYEGGVVAFPRRKYASGGGSDYDSGLGAVLEAQRAMYAPRNGAGLNIAGPAATHQLAVASGTPAPPPSGSSNVQQAVGLGKDAYQGYKWATKPAPGTSTGVAPGTSSGASTSFDAGLDAGGSDAAGLSGADTSGALASNVAASGATDAAATSGAEAAAGSAAEGVAAGAATDAAVAGATDAAATEAAALAAEYAAADVATAAVLAAKRGGAIRGRFDAGGAPYTTNGEQIDIPDEQTSVHLQSAGPLVKQPTGLQTAMKMGDPNQTSSLMGSMFSNQGLARGGIAGRRGYDDGGAPDDAPEPGADVTTDPETPATGVSPSKPSLWERIKKDATAENVVPILTGLAAMGTAPTRSAGVALASGLGAGAQSYLQTRASLANTAAEQAKARGLDIANRIATMKAQAAQDYLSPTVTATAASAPQGPPTPTTPPPQAVDTAANIDQGYRNRFYVPPVTAQESAAMRRARGASIALSSDQPVQDAQAQIQQRVARDTSANQNAAQAEADQLYAAATDPAADPAAKQAALVKYNAIHQWTGDDYVDMGGVKTNKRTGAPAIGVAAQQLSPQSWAGMMKAAIEPVSVPQSDGSSRQVPTWQYAGSASPEEYARRLASAAPPPPSSTAAAATPVQPARGVPSAGPAATTISAPATADPLLSKALADPAYKLKTPPVVTGVSATPGALDQQHVTVTSRSQILKDSEDATNAGATALQYLQAAKSIMDSKGATVGAYGSLLTSASRLLGGSPQSTNYEELAKYLGNAAIQSGKANFPNATQSEVGLQMSELSPSKDMNAATINDLLATNIRSAKYTIGSANRVKSYLDNGGDPQQFSKWNQAYYPREKFINATRTATGPRGQKLYLVNGAWVQ